MNPSKRESLDAGIKASASSFVSLVGAALSARAAVKNREDGLKEQRLAALDGQRAQLAAKDTEAHQSELSRSIATAMSKADKLVPGATSATALPALPDDALSYARYVRVGKLAEPGDASGASLPCVVPLISVGNIVVLTADTDATRAHDLCVSIAARALASTAPGQLALHLADPNMTGSFRGFRALAEQNLFHEPADTTRELQDLVERSADRIARVKYLLGKESGLADLRAAAGQPIENYELNVLLDFPAELAPETFDQLKKVVANGPASGTATIIHHNVALASPRDRDPTELYTGATLIDLRGPHAELSILPGVAVELDDPYSIVDTEELSEKVAVKAKKGAAPSISLSELIDLDGAPTRVSATGITAAIGKQGLSTVDITLGDRVEQRHNVLVAGAVGQGKSNLLLTMIHSLAASYGPDELEMYLIDFKQGMEFTPLAPHPDRDYWLPNARVIALESDREFGLAVIDHLIGEFRRRSSVVKQHGNDIESYRLAVPDAKMPRILVVIDEFQVFFEKDDQIAERAMEALETMARKMRAVGIHLVLASQTLSGIKRLAQVEGAIFGQFPLRLSMKTSRAESQVVMQPHNTEAAELKYRGEAVINTEFGSPTANRRATIAYADPSETDILRATLWREAGNAALNPVVFYSGRPAEYEFVRNRDAAALLGRAVSVDFAVTGFEFTDDPGRNLAILGDGQINEHDVESPEFATDMAAETIRSIIRSLIEWHSHGDAHLIVLDYLPSRRSDEFEFGALAELASSNAVQFDHLHDADANAELVRLANPEGSSDIGKTYVLGVGFDRAVGFDAAEDGDKAPVDALRQLLETGPSTGTHVIGWWQNTTVYDKHLSFSGSGMVNGILSLQLSTDELRNLFGPIGDWRTGAHRAVFWDRQRSDRPVKLIPFGPSSIKQQSL